MRQLTVKQKKFLVKWANENTDIMEKTVDFVSNMQIEDWQKLEAMNDTEILWQNTNRFLGDLQIKENPTTGIISYYIA